MATRAQLEYYKQVRSICKDLRIPQSKLRNRRASEEGTTTTDPGTGNTRWTGKGPRNTQEVTDDVLIWVVWRQSSRISSAGGDDTAAGAVSTERLLVQIPAIDDNQNVITVTHDDWIEPQDGSGQIFAINSPAKAENFTFWMAEAERYR